eukprot:1239688-Alexandrium_andersonii.AAC.1
MSASLVGSEMCIRDSNSIAAADARPAWHSPRISWAVKRPPPGGVSPVSYTHLTLPTICSV